MHKTRYIKKYKNSDRPENTRENRSTLQSCTIVFIIEQVRIE